MGGPDSNGISHAPLYLGSRLRGIGISSTRLSLSAARFSNTIRLFLFFLTLRKLSSASRSVLLPHCQQRLLPCTGVVWTGPCSLTTTWGISSISFPPATEMFHFTGFLTLSVSRVCTRGVAPFRYPRIKACLRLPAAFRRLLRLSSAACAKASVHCS